ncbi:MAG TPA: RNA polymerase sigma factor [Acidimicrobiales bacterium]|nr:RNA polymerase sigma factor [Acidimicrobiales bacterium]
MRGTQKDVVEAARRGDGAAWEALYREVYPKLHAYLSRRVGHDQAEDAVAETMSRAVASLHRFQFGPAGFDGWVFGIARHVALDHHRRAVRRPTEVLVGQRYSAEVGQPLDAVADGLILDDDHAAVRAAFARLDDRDQELLLLRVVGGLSAEATAEVLHKRAGAVRTAQSRALARLRQLLEAHDA